jgi:thioester reductase-like protein
MNEQDYKFIINNVTHIIHCAAAVNHMYGYSKLKTANTFSTLEFIKVAMLGREKKLSYISTESAISESNADGVGYEAKVSDTPAEFFGGYALTKWVSERLLVQAFERGMSGLILRPGNIFLNTKTGISSPITSNFALLMMRSYVDTGFAPESGFPFEAVPVNQLAEAIVALSLSEADKTMFNLSNQNEISLKEYVSILSQITKKEIQIIPFDEWKKRVIEPLKETSPLFPLTLYFQDEASEELVHFDTSLTQEALHKNGVYFDDDYKVLLGDAFSKTFNEVLHIS